VQQSYRLLVRLQGQGPGRLGTEQPLQTQTRSVYFQLFIVLLNWCRESKVSSPKQEARKAGKWLEGREGRKGNKKALCPSESLGHMIIEEVDFSKKLEDLKAGFFEEFLAAYLE